MFQFWTHKNARAWEERARKEKENGVDLHFGVLTFVLNSISLCLSCFKYVLWFAAVLLWLFASRVVFALSTAFPRLYLR